MIKAGSKKDYFEKIKKYYEEFDTIQQTFSQNQELDKGWLLYFLLNKCNGIFSDFGLDPSDFEKWTQKGFDWLICDDNLMTAVEALISGKPFAYLNGKKILTHLEERNKRVFEWPLENNEEIILIMNRIITLINSNKYKQALQIIQGESDCDDFYLYPKAFALAKVNRLKESQQTLNKLLSIKPNHKYSRILADELMNISKNMSISNRPGGMKKQIVCVVSASYSGSTLLSAILGAHSDIIAAGEVRWLIEKNIFDLKKIIERSKKLTRQNSVPWTNQTFETANYRNVYKKIFKVFKSNFIVDSSKEPTHFENIIKNTPENRYDFLFINLWKHPVRLLSSHIMHRWNRWERLKNYDRNDSIRYLINDLYNKFISINKFMQKIENNYKSVSLKYENIVEDMKSSIQRILNEINLEYESELENYETKDQYILGGNSGPKSQIAKALNGIEIKFENTIQGNFYKNINGIEMDNNYKKVFSKNEIRSIYQNDKVKILLDRLGYNQIH